MKLSRFNLWVKDYPKQGEYLLFNTRTQALLKFTRKFRELLLKSLDSPNLVRDAEITNNLATLRKNGIIVEDENEEKNKLDDFFRQLKFESRALPFEATILTTYSCNFRCVYCFEDGVKDNIAMDERTSDLIAKWLINRAAKRNYKKIFIVYYGGEPLLNTKPIYDISGKIKAWAQRNGVRFGFGMITNGSLLKPDLIDGLLPLGLSDIRVSIDGDKQAHNKKRPFLDGSPTFELVIDNIKKIIDKVKIGVSGSFDRENFGSIPGFLDYLGNEGLLSKISGFNFVPLAPRLGPKKNPAAVELTECLSFFSKDGLYNEVVNIKKELIRRGIKVMPGLGINACSLIMRDGGVTIDPKGAIYKCNSLVGYPEFSIGNVADNEFNAKSEEFLHIDAWNKCPQDCPYIPICQGGCRFFSYLENKNFTDLACKRDYYGRITPELIKLEYERLVNER